MTKMFCPNCEKETECTLYSKVYECEECKEDFEEVIASPVQTQKERPSKEEIEDYRYYFFEVSGYDYWLKVPDEEIEKIITYMDEMLSVYKDSQN
jgi:hypothetical protein